MIKIFYVDAFSQERFSGPFRLKGFEQAGFDVVAFDYRHIEHVYGTVGLNHSLLNSLKIFRPDVIFINKGHFGIEGEVLKRFLEGSPHTMLITWTGDQRGEMMEEVVKCAKHSHILAHSNDDERLADAYRKAGIGVIVEHHCATDTEMYQPHATWPESMDGEVCFFGSHYGTYPMSKFRDEVLLRVAKIFKLKLYGGNWERIFPQGSFSHAHRERFALASSGCTIQLCVNAFNDVYRYTSNRVWNALACGRMVLQHRFSGCESLLGIDKENLVYFETVEECMDLIGYYLSNKDEAHEIGMRGRKFVSEGHTYYHRAVEIKNLFDKWMETDEWSFGRNQRS